MTEADFQFLCGFLHQRSGLWLSAEKRYLVESRLGMLCRRRKLETLTDLVARLRAGGDSSLGTAVVEAMTTNETLFFRDKAPFDLFREVILPEVMTANAGRKTLRILCAAVSSGQEAYSLAMILDELAQRLFGWRIEIVGTDIAEEILERARAGSYSQFEVQRGLPVQYLLKYFEQKGERWTLIPRIRQMVRFQQHNLLQGSRHLGQFDAVFCRNVLIYFDLATKAKVLDDLSQRLVPNGAFVLGAAETVIGISTSLVPDGKHRGLYRNGTGGRAPVTSGLSFPAASDPGRRTYLTA